MKRFLTVAVLALTLAAGSAMACGPKGGKGGPDFGMMNALWSLDLNAAQEGKLDAVIKDHRQAMADLRGDCTEGCMKHFGKEKFDRAAFLKEHQDRSAKMHQLQADLFAKIHAELTPAQREAFVAKLAEGKAGNACGPKGERASCGPKGEKGKK